MADTPVTSEAPPANPAAARPLDIPMVERMLAERPGDPAVWSALGALLRQVGKPHAAIACQHRALELAPEEPGALTNLGNALLDLDRVAEAVDAQARAARRPGAGLAHLFNFAVALRQARRFEEAIALLGRLAAADPGNANLRWERALNLLQLGRYAEGFADYEARRGIPAYKARTAPGAAWTGQPLEGRTIFVTTEQGFGDALMASRFLPALKARGARVIFECHPELRRLLDGHPAVDALVPAGSTPTGYDLQCSQMSLPALLGTTLETLPPPLRPLVPEEARAKAARIIGPPDGTLRVGVVWSGRVTFKDNTRRAANLNRFLRLLEIPRVRLFSIQKGPPEAELAELGTDALVTPLGSHFDDFADTAAALERLDLVVMTDSSVAHLAGGLGRPVWNLLQYVPYWIYGADGPGTPWYPSMRLFRQSTPGDWDGVFGDAVAALRSLAAGAAGAAGAG